MISTNRATQLRALGVLRIALACLLLHLGAHFAFAEIKWMWSFSAPHLYWENNHIRAEGGTYRPSHPPDFQTPDLYFFTSSEREELESGFDAGITLPGAIGQSFTVTEPGLGEDKDVFFMATADGLLASNITQHFFMNPLSSPWLTAESLGGQVLGAELQITGVDTNEFAITTTGEITALTTGTIWLDCQEDAQEFYADTSWFGRASELGGSPAIFAPLLRSDRFRIGGAFCASTEVTFDRHGGSNGLIVRRGNDFMLNGYHYSAGRSVIGAKPGDFAFLTVRNGSGDPQRGRFSTSDLTIGDEAGSSGFLSMDGNVDLIISGKLLVGNRGAGTLNVANGATVAVEPSADMIIGAEASGSGDVWMGLGASLTVARRLVVGQYGDGALFIFDGAQVTASRLAIADYSYGGQGSGRVWVEGAGSLLRAVDSMEMANVDDSVASLTIWDGGAVRSDSRFDTDIGRWGGTADIVVNGVGSEWVLEGNLNLAPIPVVPSEVTMKVQDGGLVWNKRGAFVGPGAVTIEVDGGTWRSGTFAPDGQFYGEILLEPTVAGRPPILNIRNAGVVQTSSFSADVNNVVIIGSHGTLAADVVIMGGGSQLYVSESGRIEAGLIAAGVLAEIRNDGTLDAETVILSEFSTLSGNGEVTGNVVGAGLITPGSSAGKLTFGSLELQPTAVLRMELGGTQAGSYDELDVLGAAKLGGTLEISLIDGFAPSLADSFTVLAASSIESQFDSVRAFGGSFDIEYSATGVRITGFVPLTDPLPGDIDLDNEVNGQDLAIFARHLGRLNESIWSTGDFDGDGKTTLHDLSLLQANLGEPSSSPVESIPEPSAAALSVLALLLCGIHMGARSRLKGRRCAVR